MDEQNLTPEQQAAIAAQMDEINFVKMMAAAAALDDSDLPEMQEVTLDHPDNASLFVRGPHGTMVYGHMLNVAQNALDEGLREMTAEAPGGDWHNLPIERQHYWAGRRDSLLALVTTHEMLAAVFDTVNRPERPDWLPEV